ITLSGESVRVPGDSTPSADLQRWEFAPRTALSFNGANFHLERITVIGGQGGILSARSDIGDLYGVIVLRDVTVQQNKGDVRLFSHAVDPTFDFAGPVRVPASLLME